MGALARVKIECTAAFRPGGVGLWVVGESRIIGFPVRDASQTAPSQLPGRTVSCASQHSVCCNAIKGSSFQSSAHGSLSSAPSARSLSVNDRKPDWFPANFKEL